MSITSRELKAGLLLAGAAAVLSLSACQPKESNKESVAATVNGVAISEKRVESILKQQAERGQPPSEEARKAIIENLAYPVLAYQEALKKGLEKDPEVVDQLEAARQSVLANAFVQDYLKNNKISDAELQAEYDKLKAQSSGTQYKARHILVETEGEATAIIAQLKKDPKSFEALAKAKSKDAGSKVNGGDLGFFDPRSMVPEFSAAVAKLEKGKFTETPVKSQFGYHVILLEDTRENPIPTLEQVKPGLSQQVQQQALKKFFDDLKSKAKIEIKAQASASASASAAASAPAPAAAPAAASAAPATEPAKK